jgi:hypothetical protein
LLCNVNAGSMDHTRKYWTKLKMVAPTNLLLCNVNAGELPIELMYKYQTKLKMVVGTNGLAYCIKLVMLDLLTILVNIGLS